MKNAKSSKMCKVFDFTRKILDDFQGLLLLYIFDENIDDFFFWNVFFLKKTKNPFWDLTVFQEKVTFLLDVSKTHTLPMTIDENVSCQGSASNNNYSFRIINHSTTTTRIRIISKTHILQMIIGETFFAEVSLPEIIFLLEELTNNTHNTHTQHTQHTHKSHKAQST